MSDVAVGDRNSRRAIHLNWTAKPAFIGIVSAALLALLLVGIGVGVSLGSTSAAIPVLPLAAFLVVRAVISATSPTPRNFDTAQGQVHFLTSQAQSLAALCFAYSALKAAITLSSPQQLGEHLPGQSLATLLVTGTIAFALLVACFLLIKRFAQAGSADKELSNGYLLTGLGAYAACAFLASTYVAAVIPVAGNETVVSWVVRATPQAPLLGVLVPVMLAFFVMGNIVEKAVMNVMELFKLPRPRSVTHSEFEPWSQLPFLPTLLFDLVFRISGRALIPTAIAFAFFVLFSTLIAALIAVVSFANFSVPVVADQAGEGLQWASQNPISLTVAAIVAIVALAAFALITKLPLLIREIRFQLGAWVHSYRVRKFTRLVARDEKKQEELAKLAGKITGRTGYLVGNLKQLKEALVAAEVAREDYLKNSPLRRAPASEKR